MFWKWNILIYTFPSWILNKPDHVVLEIQSNGEISFLFVKRYMK